MIEQLYTFFFEWLFGSQIPTFMSAQGVEFTCIVFTVTALLAVLWICLIPFKALLRYFFN